ncbi:hypothetical protein EWM64_g8580 [Hericium alpestre]|uniref:HTH APSES-type domain-containing protein n=1 Tax=Hericium alpestre TaxID=135208 RepID=A0A4Y9ZLD8_9AGAM|nr:hypothetical protein EWM64_g8580 [Hericium alpestre]
MPIHTQYTAPLAGAPRPPLPFDHFNPNIQSMTASNLPSVKFQEIIRDGQSTIVARMKVPTPGGGHAFILRRLDTGAISLTTMFRAAFPTASEEAEREESAWVKANYDLAGSNKSGKARFAGTWVSGPVAKTIAEAYKLDTILAPLADAKPDPNIEYRKSARAQQESPKTTPAKNQLPTPSPSATTPNPPKRRREASPAPKATAPSTSPGKPIAAATLSVPRRSTRTASPAPSPVPKTVSLSPKAARSPVKSPLKTPRKVEVTTPAGSDETAVDEEIAEVPGPDASQDIAEQKEMIAAFKAQRDAARGQRAEEDASMSEEEEEGVQKRAREESPLKFNFKEPSAQETEERAIASNRRVRMSSQNKSLAWGVAAFAAAMSALTLIPNPWF